MANVIVSAGSPSIVVTGISNDVIVSSTACSVVVSNAISAGEANVLASLGTGTSLIGSPSKTGSSLNLKAMADSVDITWSVVGNDIVGTVTGGTTPDPHASTHELSGSDELDLTGLSGLLATSQTPIGHASTHELSGADELDLTGMSGLLATAQTPIAHASTHDVAGGDAITDLGPVTFSGVIDWTSGAVLNGLTDGILTLTDQAGTGFGRVNLGPATSWHPAISRFSSDTIAARIADDSDYAKFIASQYTGGDFLAGSGSYIGWSTRALMYSTSDGLVQLLNNAGDSFNRLNLGPANSSYPAIKAVSGPSLHIRLGNDGGWSQIQAGNVFANASVDVPAGQAYRSPNRFRIDSNADGNIRLRDWAGSSFGMLQLGGNTSSHPAIKRGGTSSIYLRLADDSNWASLIGRDLLATGVLQAGAANEIEWSTRSSMSSPLDGRIVLQNGAEDDFDLLQFGLTTSAAPGLKRNGAVLETRLADDSAFTNLRALSPVVDDDVATKGYADGLFDAPETRTLYVGKHGNDSNDGDNVGEALLTIGAAITAATALTPAQGAPVVIRIQDAGVYTESISVPSWVGIWAPEAKITDSTASGIGTGTVVLAGDAAVRFREIEQTSSTVLSSAVFRSNTTGTALAVAETIRLSNQTIGIFNGSATGGVLLARAKQVLVDTGWGVGDASSAQGHTHIDIEDIYIAGNGGTGISRFGSGSTVGRVTHILESGSPTSTLGLFCSAGSLDVTIDTIAMDTAWNIAVGGTLNMFIISATGTRTEAGTVNITEAGVTNPHQASHAGAGSDAITSLGAHDVTGNLTFTTDGLLRWGTTASVPMLERNGIQLDFRLGDDSGYAYSAIGHLGLGVSPTTSHQLMASELFTGTLAKNGMGVFPTYQPSSSDANILYGIQGNCLFGTSNWGAGSVVNALQFYPAPDYALGSVSFGSSNLNIIGITTGAVINVLTKTITANSLRGIVVGTLSHIFGDPGNVTATTGAAVEIATPSATTGTIGEQTGLIINPQLYGGVNLGMWMDGDGVGSDICMGSGSATVSDTGDSLAWAFGTNIVTITDAAAKFTADMVGRSIVITGSTSPGNDGTFVITSYISATQVTWVNASGVTEAFPGNWSVAYRADARMFYDGSNLIVDPDNLGSGRVYIGATGDDDMLLNDIEIDGDLDHDGSGAGFYGTAPIAKPTVTGAKAGNVALASLLTQLANLGLITDSTT